MWQQGSTSTCYRWLVYKVECPLQWKNASTFQCTWPKEQAVYQTIYPPSKEKKKWFGTKCVATTDIANWIASWKIRGNRQFYQINIPQILNRKLLFEAKDRVGLRTKGLQQFLNAGEILMLEGNLKLLQDTYRKGWGNNSCCNGWFGLVATLLWQVYRWMFWSL